MITEPAYCMARAVLPDGSKRFAIVDSDGRPHAATNWLAFLHDTNRSPNTIEDYGRRLAWYLSWTAQTADWRGVSVAHLAMWKNNLTSTPISTPSGATRYRSSNTVFLWMTAVRSFYGWADSCGLLTNDVASKMTELKYFAPGTPAGGEHGRTKRVLVPELATKTVEAVPEWIHDETARQALETVPLNVRDRFFIDLLYQTGIRVGEALSLFTADLHFAGGSKELNCHHEDPHFHVRLDNPVENGARAKGKARVLFANDHLVETYIDYVLERQRLLGDSDVSPHVFVNLYASGEARGAAMRPARIAAIMAAISQRIGFPLTGPHILRHTFATRLVRGIGCDPVDLDVVQDLLGHRSLNSTRVYTHDLEPAKKVALQSLRPRTTDLSARAEA